MSQFQLLSGPVLQGRWFQGYVTEREQMWQLHGSEYQAQSEEGDSVPRKGTLFLEILAGLGQGQVCPSARVFLHCEVPRWKGTQNTARPPLPSTETLTFIWLLVVHVGTGQSPLYC